MQTHGLADVEGADEVALVRTHRVIHRGLYRGHCGQVHHGRTTGHGLIDQARIGHIAFDKTQARVIQRQIGALAHG
ncbi:hypothetical protein D3C75_1352940 [compost metagenome]